MCLVSEVCGFSFVPELTLLISHTIFSINACLHMCPKRSQFLQSCHTDLAVWKKYEQNFTVELKLRGLASGTITVFMEELLDDLGFDYSLSMLVSQL